MKYGLPPVEDYPRMPNDVKPPMGGYQPKKGIDNAEPPRGGSGVPNKSSEKRKNLYAKAKVIEALSNTLERNLRQGRSLQDYDIDRAARNKLIDVINSLEV